MTRLALCGAMAALTFVAAGCPKRGEPSEDFSKARDQFNALYGRDQEQAYLDPKMAEVEALLKQVPEESSDHVLAQDLLRRIESGRERLAAEAAEREQALRAATTPTQDFAFTDEPFPPRPDAGQAADAGVGQPVEGMAVSELTGRWGDCFLPAEEVDFKGRGKVGSFELRPTAFCVQRHPGFDQRVLFVQDQKIFLVAERSRLEITSLDAGVR